MNPAVSAADAALRHASNLVRFRRWTEEGAGVVIERESCGLLVVNGVDRDDLPRIEARQPQPQGDHR